MASVCLVLGALLYEDGSMPPILLLRLKVMEKLYIKRPDIVFTISGDEEDTEAMLRYVCEGGIIPKESIIRDTKGKNSYASVSNMIRNKANPSFILLISSFHLPRCTYIARALGANPYPFRISDYEKRFSYRYVPRECFAFIKVLFQCLINKSSTS